MMPKKAIKISTYSPGGDEFDTTEWDTWHMEAGAGKETTYEFFNHQIGQDNRTVKDTSMKLAGQFPKKNGLRAFAFFMQITSAEATDTPLTTSQLQQVLRVLSDSSVGVKVEGKDFLTRFPLAEVLPPISICTTPDTAGDGDNVSVPTINKLERRLAIAIEFEEQVTFALLMETGLNELPAACEGIRLKFMMKGIKVRGK